MGDIMTDFKERAQHWPRVNNAQELAGRLSHARLKRWREYQWVADPPCHAQGKKPGESNSFIFGDAPGGGVIVSCFTCRGRKGMIDEIEERLGVAIQLRYSNGNLRYQRNSGEVLQPRPVKTEVDKTPLNADFPPKGFAVKDITTLPCWFVGAGKMGATLTYKGSTFGWRQSHQRGVKLARFGGWDEDNKIQIRPWADYESIKASCEWINAHYKKLEVRPSISLGGDKDTPAPHGLVIMDVDYKPSADKDGRGLAYKDTLFTRFTEAGWACYASNSGNGYHAIACVHPKSWYEFTYQGRPVSKIPVWEPYGRGSRAETGVSVDFFFPGAKFLIAVNMHKPIANNEAEHVLPWATAEDINNLLTLEGVRRPRTDINYEELDF